MVRFWHDCEQCLTLPSHAAAELSYRANVNETGETYPPSPEKVIKFIRDLSFSNFQPHKASNQSISSPPIDQPNEGQTEVPESLKQEIQTVMTGIWGRQFSDNDMKVSSYRICW